MELGDHRIENISEFISALKLTPRQIQEVFRVLGHMLSTTEGKKGNIFWCLGVGSIVMAALKVGNPKIFHLLGEQKLECDEAIKYLSNLLGADNIEWWFKLLLTGGGIQKHDGETAIDLMNRAGFGDTNVDLGPWSQGWGHAGTGRLLEIQEKIEQISQWK